MIGILTDPGSGGTFLTWSIYYLSGRSHYFLVEKNSEVELTSNPVTVQNAHNFIPNQPNRLGNLDVLYQIGECFKKFKLNDEIVYMHNFVAGSDSDTKTGIEYLSTLVDKIILVSSKQYPLYHFKYKPRMALLVENNALTTDPDKIYNFRNETYFASSSKLWQESQLTNIWDKREFMALNFDPTTVLSIEDHFDFAHDHFYLDAFELFNLKTFIKHVFEYLDLPITADRYQNWERVYAQWQQLHESRILFVAYFDTIINYILKGYDMDLSRFDLDLQQEAAIQRCLIYNHNLNFKTWQLEKFSNTKQLHNLLETNPHNLKEFT